MALRRDIYLEVASATSKMMEYLTSFSRFKLPDEQRQEILKGNAAALHRVQIIGNLETLTAFGKAQDYFGHKVLDLLEIKADIDLVQIDVSSKEEYIQTLFQLSDQTVKTLQVSKGKPEFEPLLERLRELEKTRESEQQLLKTLRGELGDKQINMGMESLKAANEFTQLLLQPVILVRRELGIPIEEAAYLERRGDSSAQIRDHLGQMIERVRAKAEAE